MIKKLLIFLILLSLCSPVYGATQQVFSAGTNDNLHISATEYFPLAAMGVPAGWQGTESIALFVWPASGTIDDFRMVLQNDPNNASTGEEFAFMVRLDTGCDGTGADTSLTCTVGEGSTTCNNSDGFSINAGECVALRVIPANSPTIGDAWWSFTWNPTNIDETVLSGGTESDLLGNGSPRYVAITGSASIDATEFDRTFIAPTDGTFKNFYVHLRTAPNNGAGSQTRTFTFRDDGSSDSIACTITEDETTCNNTSDTFANVSAGDLFVVSQTIANTPTDSTLDMGIVFVPDTSGRWIIALSSDNPLHVTTTEYIKINAGDNNWNSTETVRQHAIQTGSFASDMDILNIYAEVEADIGDDADVYVFTLRDAAAGTALTCTVDGTAAGANKCNASSTINMTDDALMTTESNPAGPPNTAQFVHISYTGFITPTVDAAAYTHLMLVD